MIKNGSVINNHPILQFVFSYPELPCVNRKARQRHSRSLMYCQTCPWIALWEDVPVPPHGVRESRLCRAEREESVCPSRLMRILVLLGPPAPDHDPVLDVVEALGMRDLVRTETFCLGLVDLLSHALLFGGRMAVNHIVEPGSGHLETADTVAVGVNPALFGSVLFWIEISHVRILLFLHRFTQSQRQGASILVIMKYQVSPAIAPPPDSAIGSAG
jgi:hypothetical protein